MFKIYTTTGTYPNLTLNEELFSHENVSISGGITKTIEDDVIPLEAFADAWDSYTVTKTVQVSGTLTADNTLVNYTNVAGAYKVLDKIMMDYATTTAWTNTPDFNNAVERDVLAFVFYVPDGDGTDTTITYYGLLTNFKWNFKSGGSHINYDLTFKSYARRWVL